MVKSTSKFRTGSDKESLQRKYDSDYLIDRISQGETFI